MLWCPLIVSERDPSDLFRVFCSLFPDTPVTIVVPLQETTTIEGETVTLQCEVSKPDVDGVWFKDNVELAPDEKFEPILDGVFQALTIHDVELEDEAEYTIEVPGDSSTATLWVEGTS